MKIEDEEFNSILEDTVSVSVAGRVYTLHLKPVKGFESEVCRLLEALVSKPDISLEVMEDKV
jgi:hypothetical protein